MPNPTIESTGKDRHTGNLERSGIAIHGAIRIGPVEGMPVQVAMAMD
jgi:hypothetical protein